MILLYVKIAILRIVNRISLPRGIATSLEAAILAPFDNSFSMRTPEAKGEG